jgi:hypothetical protein
MEWCTAVPHREGLRRKGWEVRGNDLGASLRSCHRPLPPRTVEDVKVRWHRRLRLPAAHVDVGHRAAQLARRAPDLPGARRLRERAWRGGVGWGRGTGRRGGVVGLRRRARSGERGGPTMLLATAVVRPKQTLQLMAVPALAGRHHSRVRGLGPPVTGPCGCDAHPG